MEAHTQPEAETETTELVEEVAERGASLVEYALLIALIALICFASITLLGSSASTGLSGAADSLMTPN